MKQDIKIIEYQEKYSKDIINHIRKIAMEKFEYKDWEDYFNRMSFEEYKNKGNKFWIALDDEDKVVGTIGALKISDKEVRMNSLYVNKEYRELGIAKKLYSLFTEFVKEQKYECITLRTFFKFTHAINFYEKEGFIKYNEDDESYFYIKSMINKR